MDYLTHNVDELIQLHNDARISKWLWKAKPLSKNNKLTEFAQNWANKMAVQDNLYHSNMRDIMTLGFSNVAENIAYGQKSAEEVMKTWMKSYGHRSNILNSNFTQIGCGMSFSQNGRVYWCVCFGRE
jgi:uncharacterized protein YkwD